MFEQYNDRENKAEPMSFKAGILDAFGFVRDNWNSDRKDAVNAFGVHALLTRDTAMEDAYADHV